MNDEKKYVTNVWAPAEYDREGNCPHCFKRVFLDYNMKYCGECGKRIYWEPKDIEDCLLN